MRSMDVEFVRRLRELMKNEKMALEKENSTSDWISNGLFEFSHRMLYQLSTLALIGEIDLTAIEKDFLLFDQKFYYFAVSLPRWIRSWLLSRELQARIRLPDHGSGIRVHHRDVTIPISTNTTNIVLISLHP